MELARDQFEAFIEHGPLVLPELRTERRRRLLGCIFLIFVDPAAVLFIFKPKAQHVVGIRQRTTQENLVTYPYLDAEGAAFHLADIKARLDRQAPEEFARQTFLNLNA